MREKDFFQPIPRRDGSDSKKGLVDLPTFDFKVNQDGQASSTAAMVHLPDISLVSPPNDKLLQPEDERVALDKRPTVAEDLQTLTDPNSTVAAAELAGLGLVERAAEPLCYPSEDARDAIWGLRKVVDSNSHSRRTRREAHGLLLDVFDRLSDGGRGLANTEVRERIAQMGATALEPLRKLVAENPGSSDATEPERAQIRDYANQLIGIIEARENLHSVWQAFSELRPDKAQTVLKDMIASGKNLSDTRGLGTITELRKFAEEWRPGTNKRMASEKALTEIANVLLRDGKALDDKRVRDRIRAIGPSADALQRILRENPPPQTPQSDRANSGGRRLGEMVEELLDGIGKDVVQKLTDDAADARNHQRAEAVGSTSKLLSTMGGDIGNPLAGSVLRSLNDEYHDWRPGTDRQQFAQNILQHVAKSLLFDGRGLADPAARSLLRDIGPAAIPALKEFVEFAPPQNGRNLTAENMAEAAREVIDLIEADEKGRPVVVPKSRSAHK